MGENPLGFWVLGLGEESLTTEVPAKCKPKQWKTKGRSRIRLWLLD